MKKLTTGQTNLLKSLGLDTLPLDGVRDIIERNRFSGQTVELSALENELYKKAMGFYRQYEMGGKPADIRKAVSMFDKTKLLLLHFNSDAYFTLID